MKKTWALIVALLLALTLTTPLATASTEPTAPATATASATATATATPTAEPEPEQTMEVSALPAGLVKGDTMYVTVTTDPVAAGVSARLERRILPGGSWGTIRSGLLDDTGSITFDAKPNSYKSFGFRVVLDDTDPVLTSEEQVVTVVATAAEAEQLEAERGDNSVVVTDLPAELTKGDTLYLTVTTEPALAGVTARFERRVQGGTWGTIRTGVLDENGEATFDAKPNSYRTFDFRVAIDAAPTRWSRTQSVTVIEGTPTPTPPPDAPPGDGVVVTVTDLPAKIDKGDTVSLTATTDPELAGVTARFERRAEGGSWGAIRTGAIGADGTVEFSATPNSYKTFDFRVAIETNPVVRSRVQSVDVVAGAPVTNYTPTTGALFNNPFKASSVKHRISLRIEKAINATPGGETIRLIMFSHSRKPSATALINAHNRGVNVQVILNDHEVSDQTKRVRRVLGSNPAKGSFVQVCDNGCRTGSRGNQHMKYLAFSKTGGVENVLMVTSGNLTAAGGAWQWNDLMTIVGKPTLYRNYVEIFDEAKWDQRVPDTYRFVRDGSYVTEFLPTSSGKSNDPAWRELQRVECRGATGGAGRNGRTVVQVSMWTWRADRGMYLASKLRDLDAQGCYVEVVVGAPSGEVLRELRRTGPNGGIAVRDSRKDYRQNGYWGEPSYTKGAHHKYLIINGVYNGDTNARHVLTGSMNWTGGALTSGDEVVVNVTNGALQRLYQSNFQTMFNNRTYTSVLRNY